MAAAIDFGNRDLVKLFLKHRARLESSLHMYFLRHSSRDVEKFEGILQDFLDAGWDLNDSYILRDAAAARNEVLFRWLLYNGADPNKRPDTGTSPMSCIAEKGTLTSLQLLFDHGTNTNNNSMSAAARRGKDDIERIVIMQLLIANGGDVNALEVGIRRPSSSAFHTAYPPRHTALYEAARADVVGLLEFLMKSGVDPRLRIRFGEEERTAPWAAMLASKERRLQALGAKIKSGLSSIDAVKAE
ncbi:ankyrin repeat-containing domain protein [Bisporella sp. PMI_857]|nr:ankyrin repeat-containing domain protein [Bisporella sp. PMI_857]